MKHIHKILLIVSSLFVVESQANAQCGVHLMVAPVHQGEEIPDDVNNMLMTRLETAVCATGVIASPNYDRFFITGKFTHFYKDVVPGPPMSNALRTSLTLYIGDAISQKVYASSTYELYGVGTSETRAFVNAMRQLNGENDQLKKFIDAGIDKIVEYYDQNYLLLIKQAEKAVAMRNYEEALGILAPIPECCKGYNQVSGVFISAYDKYIDYEGQMLLTQAQAAWVAQPDSEGAARAYDLLSRIDPNANCYNQVVTLGDEIKSVVKANWDFENRQKYQDTVDTERNKIEAARAVGVAWGNSQKSVIFKSIIK